MLDENMPKIIETKNLSFHYSYLRPGLQHVDLELAGGQIVGLLGPNGSGKTTLIKLLAAQLQPSEGEIRICGAEPGPESKLQTAYLPDRDFMAKWMKLEDLLYFYESFFPDFDKEKALDFMKALRLDPGRSVKDMSLGERERVAIALTMSRRVKLYLLDEPIGGVDPAMRELVFRTIIRDFPEDALVLMSTHLLAEAEPYLDRVIFLKDGRILCADDAEHLRLSTGNSVDQYFKGVFRWY